MAMVSFVSMMNPRLDLDLLPQWINHYAACGFDRYTVYLHQDGLNDQHCVDAMVLLRGVGWEVETVAGEFNNGLLIERTLQLHRDSLDPMDVMVIADSDEFHDISPQLYHEMVRRYVYVTGQLVDRWKPGPLQEVDGRPLQEQYPCRGSLLQAIRLQYGITDDHWEFPQSKVLFSRVNLPVMLNGSHRFRKKVSDGVPHVGGIDVDHYSWRPSAIKRICTKSYFPHWWVVRVMDYFNVPKDDPDYLQYLDRCEERGRRMEEIAAMTVGR
jgi:hypothetical protein